ncbi:MAG: kelch repeat-containing protein, partial [Myxococcota bacterium]
MEWRWRQVWVAVAAGLVLGFGACEGNPQRPGDPAVAQRTEALDPSILANVTPVDPPTRFDFMMAELGGRIVAFGGDQGGGYQSNSNLTWVFENGRWRALATPTSPPVRRAGAMVRFGNELLLFGGRMTTSSPNPTYFNDLWRFDGTTWSEVTSTSKPSPRAFHVMGVLSINNVERLFLFGGQGPSGVGNLSDTWEWTGTDWVQLSPTVTPASGGSPPSGGGFAMAQTPFQSKLVMFGGWNDQLWEFDGQAWVGRRPTTRPGTRVYPSLAVVGTKLVLFGGYATNNGNNIDVNDTWEWDGTSWTRLTLTTAPRARSSAVALTYNGTLFLHGGKFTRPGGSTSGLSDTWEFDGTQWTELLPTPVPRPEGRRGHAMVNVGSDLLLFGGKDWVGVVNNDTWRWSSSLGWRRLAPTSSPSAREYHAMVTVGSRVLLFGGRNGTTVLGDTWEWTGSDWELKSPATSPPARLGHGLAVVGTNVLLFGGSSGTAALGDTWLWDGTTWTQLSPATSPSARQFHGMGSYLGTPMVLGGIVDRNDQQTALGDLWEWTGTTWQQRTPATPLMMSAFDGFATVETSLGLLFIPGRRTGAFYAQGLLWWGNDFSQVFFQSPQPQSPFSPRHSTAAGVVPEGVLLVGGGTSNYDSNSVVAESWLVMLTPPDAGTDGGVDAGIDAGTPAQDAGTPAQDAGTPAQDAGMPTEDA